MTVSRTEPEHESTDVRTAPDSGLLVVRLLHHVTPELAEAVWQVHEEAFAEFADKSAFLTPADKAEWDGYMVDESVLKVIAWVDGEVAGFMLIATDLGTVHWVDERFYARKYPGRKVIYVTYTAVSEAYRHPRVLKGLFETGLDWATERNAVVGFDSCSHNVERRFVDLIARITRRYVGDEPEEVSSLHFFTFDSAGRHSAS